MQLEDVKTILEDLLARLPVENNGVEIRDADTHPRLHITTPDSGALIGTGGETLRALQHIVRRIAEQRSSTADPVRFLLDVNGYQERRLNEIRNHARILAERARMFHYDVEMQPMNAYERMIVHALFAGDTDITTHSQGEGKFRRVVITSKGSENAAPLPSEAEEFNVDSRF